LELNFNYQHADITEFSDLNVHVATLQNTANRPVHNTQA